MSPPVNILHTSATGNLGDHAKLGLANASLLRYLAGRLFYGGKGGGKTDEYYDDAQRADDDNGDHEYNDDEVAII